MTLREFFDENKKIAIALSGGIDSVFLMYAAKKYGADVCAYFIKTEFQPSFELRDAAKEAERAEVPLKVIEVSVLSDEEIAKNSSRRCYYCKRRIMSEIVSAAKQDGFCTVVDGTNASDDVKDRPGYQALGELAVLSPLKLCGISKDEVRRAAKEWEISLWEKPSYACLATRIKQGEEITQKKLEETEKAESFLHMLGFSDFRVRVAENNARIELRSCDTKRLIDKKDDILSELGKCYGSVSVDLGARDEKLSD